MQETKQQQKYQYYCKNHPDKQSNFFVSDQPQIKYCNSCALNMALCGRKIQKQLTKEQSRRKQLVNTFVTKIRQTILQIETNHLEYQQLTSIIQFSSPSVFQKIEIINSYIKQLIQLKSSLQTQFENQLNVRLNNFNIKKTNLKQRQSKLVQQLQKIQSNFVSLIEIDDDKQFQIMRYSWDEIINESNQQFLKITEFHQQREKIGDFLTKFEKEYKDITKLRLPESLLHQQNTFKYDWNKQNGPNQIGLNTFNCNNLVQELKLNLTANAKLKSRNNTKRSNNDMQGKNNQSKKDKKNSHIDDGELFPIGKRINH